MRFSIFDVWWLAMGVLVGNLLTDLIVTLWRRSFCPMSARDRMNRRLAEIWPQLEEHLRLSLRALAPSGEAKKSLFPYSSDVVMTMAYSAHLRGELTDVLKREAVLAYVDGTDWPGPEEPEWLVDGAAAEEKAREMDGEEIERGSCDGGVR